MGSSRETEPLITERIASLEHKLAVKEQRMVAIREIGAALSSTLNLDKLLALIMEKTTQLMDADRSTLFLLDQDRGELWSKVMQGDQQQEIRVALGDGVAGWVGQTGEAVNIPNAYDDPRFNDEFDRKSGYRTETILCLPMRNHRGKVIGVIQVLNKNQGSFTRTDEKLLNAITGQAAISIENSKLYLSVVSKNIELQDTQGRLRRRLEELDLLFRIEQEIGELSSLAQVLESLLRQACETIPSQGAILVLKEKSGWRRFVYPPPKNREQQGASIELDPQHCAAATVFRTGEPRRVSAMTGPIGDDSLAACLGAEIRSLLCVPIPIPGEDKNLGAVQLVNRLEGVGYTENNLKLLTVITGQASSAIRRVRARTEELNANRLAAIGQALSGVLHDLKTPMTIIGGYAELMADEEEAEERAELAAGIGKQISALSSMTGELLGFARGDSNLLIQKVQLHVFMDEIAEGLAREYAESAKRHGTIELHIDQGYKGPIRMDEGKMKRVVYNLARNAQQAMPKGGRFTIETGLDDTEANVVLRFTDTGAGIPPDIRAVVFDSFVTSGKESGTGLGLAIVKKVVDLHGGTITFTTDTDSGTTFTITLPRNLKA
jgi:signal transduction histidine kinase/putative methionine-R-sulfoxide reductase with GAF domain